MPRLEGRPVTLESDARGIADALLEWYRHGHRDLPWRRTRDPYRVWISEIMCQQTQVDTVAPRYERFVERFPTVRDLAAVREEEVCEEWAGLGYYSRARNLHRAARLVVAELDGHMPGSAAELRRLPGIGRYTAGAIASIAHGERAAVVDGNVGRVLSRMFELAEVPTSPAGQKQLWSIAERLVPAEHPGDFNQALMELGATVCTPRAPRCLICPARAWCGAHREGTVERYPTPKPRAKRKELRVAFAWVEPDDGGLWLSQRGLEGLWAGLWELPSAETPTALATLLGLRRLAKPLARVEHTLSHRDVIATVYAARPPRSPPSGWRVYRDPLSAPLSALARKAIEAVGLP